MRLDFLPHPEYLLGTRGNPKIHEFYKTILGGIRADNTVDTSGWPEAYRLFFADEASMCHFICCKKFLDTQGECFYIPRDFLRVLARMDKDIPLDCLPQKFAGYFHFAADTIVDDQGPIESAYVLIDTAKNLNITKNSKDFPPEGRAIMVSYLNKKKPEETFATMGMFLWPLFRPINREEIAVTPSLDIGIGEDLVKIHDKMPGVRFELINAILNATLYVHSADPDILRLKPTYKRNKTQKAEVRGESTVENRCAIPITLLNWEYHVGRQYSKDTIFVDTFPRWQRCGPGFSQVKYIWVTPFERHPKNVKNQTKEKP